MLHIVMYGAVLLMSLSESVQITADIRQLFIIFRSGLYCHQVLTNLFETFKNLQDASKTVHLNQCIVPQATQRTTHRFLNQNVGKPCVAGIAVVSEEGGTVVGDVSNRQMCRFWMFQFFDFFL